MSLDATLVARQVGVSANYKSQSAGRTLRKPQRIYLIAQAAHGASYTAAKSLVTSAAEGAALAGGFLSQAYYMLRDLFPANGDGVRTVPVTLCVLPAADGATRSTGDITPSGTAAVSASYRVNISNRLSSSFVLPAGVVSVNDANRKMANAVNGTLGLGMSATHTYGAGSADPGDDNAGDGTVTSITTTGSPKPGVWTLTCIAEAADAGMFRLVDPDGVIVSSSVTVGAQTQAGLGFTLTDGTADFEIGDTFTITVPSTKVNLHSGWAGTSANRFTISIEGPATGGVSFAITQPTGGAGDPDVSGVLAQIGQQWESILLSGCDASDSVALDALKDFGEGRWLPTVKKPLVAITGQVAVTPQEAIVITDARKTDRVNVLIPTVGSNNHPCAVAARAACRVAVMANSTPAHDYCLIELTGIEPGADGDQWDLAKRDIAVKGGSSSLEVLSNTLRLSDTVTCYHPDGEDPPAYRYVCDIVKLMNIVYNVDTIFSDPEWAGAPLVPDSQPVTEPTAKKPKMALAAISKMLDALALDAIISDPAASKAAATAVIDSGNPKRLNVTVPVKLSGNTNVIDAVLNWSFYFGAAPVVG